MSLTARIHPTGPVAEAFARRVQQQEERALAPPCDALLSGRAGAP